jgi:hypothetical protein
MLLPEYEVYFHKSEMVAYLPWDFLKARCDNEFTYELAFPDTNNGLYHFNCDKDSVCTADDAFTNAGRGSACLPTAICQDLTDKACTCAGAEFLFVSV